MYGKNSIVYPGGLYFLIVDLIKNLGDKAILIWAIFTVIFASILIFLAFDKSRNLLVKCFPKIRSIISSDIFFTIIIFLGTLFIRAPNLIQPELNPDESIWIVNAATLIKDPRFWLSVDGSTSGPLNIFPLILINLLGGTLNYVSIRLFGLFFCMIPAIIFLYFTLKNFFRLQTSRLLIVPCVLSITLFNNSDLIAFNSEQIPMVLISFAMYLILSQVSKNEYKRSKILLIGLILGSAFYAKLQSLGIILGLITFLIIDLKKNTQLTKKFHDFITYLFIGLSIPTILVLIYSFLFGLYHDFFQSYIINNFFYVSRSRYNLINIIKSTYNYANLIPDIKYFITLSFFIYFLNIFLLFNLSKKLNYAYRRLLLFSITFYLSVVVTVVIPLTFFAHYQNLMIVPSFLLISVFFGIILEYKILRLKKIIYLFILTLLIFISFIGSMSRQRDGIKRILSLDNIIHISPVSNFVSKFAKPNDKLVIWGWATFYHVEAGLIQGTRDVVPFYQITNSSQQNHYVERYLSDMKLNEPTFFIQAITKNSFAFNNPNAQDIENYPLISQYIYENYKLINTIEGNQIFIRNDRINQIK